MDGGKGDVCERERKSEREDGGKGMRDTKREGERERMEIRG